jgi:hypothetical protein
MNPCADSPLPPQFVPVVDQLTRREHGIGHPHRYWYWRRLQKLAQAKLIVITPDPARGFDLVQIAWTDAGRAAANLQPEAA